MPALGSCVARIRNFFFGDVSESPDISCMSIGALDCDIRSPLVTELATLPPGASKVTPEKATFLSKIVFLGE
jgi:hypothetical protein